MGLESVTYIADLNTAWPLATDPLRQGDDHLRLLKSVLQANFPNLGNSVAVNPTAVELNHMVGATSAVQTQLNAVTSDVATNTAAIAALEGAEVGDIKLRSAATAGTKWLVCNAQAVSRTTYATLFALIGTSFGVGDGSTTFNLPDLRGRVPVGVGTGDAADATAFALADKDGAETHTLTVAEMPAHTHSYSLGNTTSSGGSNTAGNGSSTTGSTGGNGAHNNLQPSLALNFFIKSL
jgi:microcystin-dependent protein